MSSDAATGHVPVLLDAVIDGLSIRPSGRYIDGTLGRGGHSAAILDALGPGGRLTGIDRDPQAIAETSKRFAADPRMDIVKGEIAQLEDVALERGLIGRVDGLLLDLGVSSPQLDEAGRGFSFRNDGPLDMRMDPDSGISAAEWLQSVDERDLRIVLFELGEEAAAPRIARAIIAARNTAGITRTSELADIVEAAVPARAQKRHPATKTFQAIRMFINRELEQLGAALDASIRLLATGGRLCVISFHSLEDRRVKRFIRDASREPVQYRGLPDVPPEFRPTLRSVGRAVTATDAEVAANPRARSARLRIAERL